MLKMKVEEKEKTLTLTCAVRQQILNLCFVFLFQNCISMAAYIYAKGHTLMHTYTLKQRKTWAVTKET